MIQTIQLGTKAIEYTLRTSRRSRRFRMTIYPGGELRVSAPQRASPHSIERFIRAKARWVIAKMEYFRELPPPVSARIRKHDFEQHKAAALALALDRIGHFNALYGFRYGKITIRNQKTRLGSCSRAGNLNFNYKIALMPPHHADYIIVHELCHTAEFNHSRKFWDLVARSIPNHREIRRELKRT